MPRDTIFAAFLIIVQKTVDPPPTPHPLVLNLWFDVISCWQLLQAVASIDSCYKLSPALTAVASFDSCCQLWQLLQAVDSIGSCYKLSPALTAVASFDRSYKLSPALTAVTSCCRLWQLLQAFPCFDTCYKLLPALTAVTSYWQLHLNFITTSTFDSITKSQFIVTSFDSWHA